MDERCVQNTVRPVGRRSGERCSARSARFVVREIEGYAISERAAGVRPGLSIHVLDRLTGYRAVASWRSEEVSTGGYWPRSRGDRWMRDTAAEHAAKLNAQHEATL
jgi:hypothetical protein